MKARELFGEIRDAAAEGVSGIYGIFEKLIKEFSVDLAIALLILPFWAIWAYFNLSSEARLILLGWLAIAVAIGIFLRVRRG